MPEEYIDFLMMKNVYQCTPNEYEMIDDVTIQMHQEFLGVENAQREIESKRAEQRARIKK